MPFRYRLQKVLDFRIKKKEAQLQAVIKAQQEVYRVEALIEKNNREIAASKDNMRKADPMMYEAYDNFIKHLYEVGEDLELEKQKALDALQVEKDKLVECEKEVKVLEKHKENMHEAYKAEEKAAELKRLSEVAVQKYFARTKEQKEDEELDELIKKGDSSDEN
ncbi:MAG: hypothetical protein PHV37_06795 [Candidatus Gastranaerophilales bacterium]|nr:hypothetical protein [Candidatus Gastranaerophilales bacterium]